MKVRKFERFSLKHCSVAKLEREKANMQIYNGLPQSD